MFNELETSLPGSAGKRTVHSLPLPLLCAALWNTVIDGE